MARGSVAVAILLAVAVGQLVDALHGGDLMGSPVVLLASACSGYAVGLATRWRMAVPAVVASAAALTWAYQLGDPGAYPVLDDLVFALLVVGGPALAGAAVRGRSGQVRELERLATLLDTQRRSEVRAASLEERNRVQMSLHDTFSEQVAAISMRAESAMGAEAAETQRALAEVESAARQSLDQLRDALGELREEDTSSTTQRIRTSGPPLPAVSEPPTGLTDIVLSAVCGLLIAVEAVVSPQSRGPVAANIAVALVATLPLVVRRHRPVMACGATLGALSLMGVWLTSPTAMVTPILVLLVCGYTAGAHTRGAPQRTAAVAVVAAGVAAAAWVSTPAPEDDGGVVPVLVVLGLAVLVGTVTAGWTERAAQRRAAVAELRRRAEVDVELAVAEQRERLAGELHDTVAHAMTVICLQASAGQIRLGSDTLATILTTARNSLAELREGLAGLGHAHELGVASLTEAARRAGLSPHVTVTGSLDEVPAQARRLAARVVREAITNAGRYAPGSHVRIEVAAHQELRLSVVDAGSSTSEPVQGVTLAGAGTGLRGLAAEAERAGGLLSWGPAGSGFRVEARLPGVGVRA